MIFIKQKLPLSVEIDFFRTVGIYLQSGISLMESLELIREHTKDAKLQKELATICSALTAGKSFQEAWRESARPPSTQTQAFLTIGEETGTLADACIAASTVCTESRSLQQKLSGACLYPALILLGSISMAVGVVVFVLPNLVSIFETLDSPLPISTRILLAIGLFLSDNWFWIILFLCVVYGCIWFLLKKYPRFRMYCEKLLLRTPLIGSLMRNYYATRIAYLFEHLLLHGVNIVSACTIASSCQNMLLYREALTQTSTRIIQGLPLFEAFAPLSPYVTTLFMQALRIGEQTGTLPERMGAARVYGTELFQTTVTRVTVLIEPILMIGMGLMVGGIVISVMTPIFDITTSLQNR